MKLIIIAMCTILLGACARIDGTNADAFEHSIRTICDGSDLDCTVFQLKVATLRLHRGGREVRVTLDGLTYSEAKRRVDAMDEEDNPHTH